MTTPSLFASLTSCSLILVTLTAQAQEAVPSHEGEESTSSPDGVGTAPLASPNPPSASPASAAPAPATAAPPAVTPAPPPATADAPIPNPEPTSDDQALARSSNSDPAAAAALARLVHNSRPAELPYEDGEPVPDGYHLDSRMRRGLIIGGSVVLGVFYLPFALGSALGVDLDREDALDYVGGFVPVAGPFILMATNDTGSARVLFLAGGLAQAGGAAMLLAGIFAKQPYLRRNLDPGPVSLSVIPSLSPQHTGLTLHGAF